MEDQELIPAGPARSFVAALQPRSPSFRWLIVVPLLLGVAARAGWAIYRAAPIGGEAQNVAVALATGRGFADPYFVGSGPTAHLLPVSPLIAGAVYGLFGPHALISEIVLEALALLEVFGTFLLTTLLFVRLGLPRLLALCCFAFLSLAPLFFGPETVEFRYWEGALATLTGAAILLWATDEDPFRKLLLPAVLIAWGWFVSPQVGLAGTVVLLVTIVVHRAWSKGAKLLGLLALALACLFGPWTVRNQNVFHRPIVMRSNLGLELAVANHDRAYADDSWETLWRRFAEIHPSQSKQAQATYLRVGEVAYFEALKTQTLRWIHENPGKFLSLCARHVRQQIVPSAWQFASGSKLLVAERLALYSFIALTGLLGCLWAVAALDRRFACVLIFIGTIMLSYAPFQPVLRYLYLNYINLVFCSATFLYLAYRTLIGRGRKLNSR